MIDKSDEFQLINFILDFKKMIFFTAGVLNTIIGYLLYFNCATLNEYVTHEDFYKFIFFFIENINLKTRCLNYGPGQSIDFFVDTLSFFLQIILVWLSFVLLQFSKAKGLPKFHYLKEIKSDLKTCCCCIISTKRFFCIS